MTQRLLNSVSKAGILKVLLLTFFIANIVPVSGQSKADGSPATLLTRFPFTTLSGGVIVINAQLDPFTDTLNFILDTGSGGISLDSSLVVDLNLPQVASDRMLRGIGSLRKISFINDRTLQLPGLNVEHLNFHINNYDLLTSTYGVRIDGIIGHSFLSRYIVKIDYDKSMIEVWKQGKIKYPKKGILLKPAINNIPVLEASVEDGTASKSRFFFDTGAGLSLLMNEDFERDSAILRKGKKVILTQAEGVGGKKPMKLTTVKQISIGPYIFKKVPAHIFKDDYNVTAYPELGGLIGNDLLRRFNVILNYRANEIHMRPNTHFREQFDYSYTGLGIYLDKGEIVIEDVLKNSPAEQAGLQPGDVLVAIDNQFKGNIQQYKEMMQQVGSRLKFLVLRNKELHMFYLKVKSLLKETSG